MPYDKVTELPDNVRDSIPEDAQKIYLEAYNGADANHPDWDEGRKHQYAWGAVKNVYEKKDDKWVKKD